MKSNTCAGTWVTAHTPHDGSDRPVREKTQYPFCPEIRSIDRSLRRASLARTVTRFGNSGLAHCKAVRAASYSEFARVCLSCCKRRVKTRIRARLPDTVCATLFHNLIATQVCTRASSHCRHPYGDHR
jgi:hypothetical protein